MSFQHLVFCPRFISLPKRNSGNKSKVLVGASLTFQRFDISFNMHLTTLIEQLSPTVGTFASKRSFNIVESDKYKYKGSERELQDSTFRMLNLEAPSRLFSKSRAVLSYLNSLFNYQR